MGDPDLKPDESNAATPPAPATTAKRESDRARVVVALLVLIVAVMLWRVSVQVAALSEPRDEYRTDFDRDGDHHFVATELPPGELTPEEEDALQDEHLDKLDRYKSKLDARAARRKEPR